MIHKRKDTNTFLSFPPNVFLLSLIQFEFYLDLEPTDIYSILIQRAKKRGKSRKLKQCGTQWDPFSLWALHCINWNKNFSIFHVVYFLPLRIFCCICGWCVKNPSKLLLKSTCAEKSSCINVQMNIRMMISSKHSLNHVFFASLLIEMVRKSFLVAILNFLMN